MTFGRVTYSQRYRLGGTAWASLPSRWRSLRFAEQHDLSQAYVSDVLLGRREPGEKFLAAIRAERVVCYRLLAAPDK